MKESFWIKPALAQIPDEQLETLHRASMKILAKTGVHVHSAQVRNTLQAAGARVKDDLRVYIPAELVERALSTAPSRIDVYDRTGQVAMVLEGPRSYFGTGSDLKYTFDLETQQRRESTLKDVELSARLCDKLTNMDFVMSHALPNDVSTSRCETEQMRVMLDNTSKPLVMTIYSGLATFEQMHEMACQACDGESNFRKAPNYVLYSQYISPLQQEQTALDRLLFCADHGIPIIYMSALLMGASSPVTLAGTLALANAECLAGLVIHQLQAPGAPFIYGGNNSALDMKTMTFCYGAPEWRINDIVIPQLAARYNLPNFATAGATDAKGFDAQAGAEWAYSIMLDIMSGSNLIHDVGYMDSGLTGSLESLVICDEIIGMAKHVTKGFELSEETLALDIIDEVGPAGSFIEHEHTLERFRKDIWYPTVFERNNFAKWQDAGAKDVMERARERVNELLK
ncbi:MAG: trimethylamine methyltransferase [Actinobacteria bacterium]|nr:trimethylamine methyltransferase [Actinomycetota bacterium]